MKKRSKIKLRGIDKLMLFVIAFLLVSSPILIVYSKSELSKSNIEVEKMRLKLEKQDTINESISMKINELASLTNIQDIAKEYGLSYQNDNIIVVK